MGNVGIGTIVYLARKHGYPRSGVSQRRRLPVSKPAPKQTKPTSSYAKQLFLAANSANEAVADHPYTKTKGIGWSAGAGRGMASGSIIGEHSDCIIVPVRRITDNNKVQGVQCINTDGKKQTFGNLSGGALLLGNTLNLKATWFVAEGWASAVSTVFHHHKEMCARAFGKGNMRKVAEQISEHYSPKEIVILEEQD